jgi:hypothetical protein
MLELDYLHRVRSPLDPILRGKMRLVAAQANGCGYTQAQAVADLARAGLDVEEARKLSGAFSSLHGNERDLMSFARKMTVDASSVTDGEMAALIKEHGEAKVVAMVQLLAYASFQDRLLLSLGLASDEASPPLEVRFARKKGDIPQALRKEPQEKNVGAELFATLSPEWSALNYADLKGRLEKQKERASRIRVPEPEAVRKLIPQDLAPKKPLRIRWSLVCMGYQPELAAGWSACTRAFRSEAKRDRVLEESIFWVVTRTLHCFY